MVKRNPFLSGVCAILGGVVMMGAGTAAADVTSDNAAGLLIYPKLVLNGEFGVDTVIQLTNTSADPVNVRCFYVNANSHCSNDPATVCNTSDDCTAAGPGGLCIPGWQEIDFRLRLTANQPISWTLGSGLPIGSFPLDGISRIGRDGEFNSDSAIPGAPEDPFRGELKCVQVGDDEAPIDRNDLKGEATIVTASAATTPNLDARGYNALGVQARAGANDGDNTLILGDEYDGCPNILILDHFFDDAIEPVNQASVRTDLTLVPCSENFVRQETYRTTVQFLVFNEFEQRFSTSTSVECFRELALSDIDTRDRSLGDTDPTTTGDSRSIFNVGVQGTLTGQTRIRGVDDGVDGHGNGLLAVAEEFHRSSATDLSTVTASAAFNIHQVGERPTTDVISIP